MRKKFAALGAALLLMLAFSCPALAADPITIQVNGKILALEATPVVENGRTLVPVRAIAESLGAHVQWQPETRRVEIELEERSLALIIDNAIAYVDGVPKQLDVPARIVGGYTLVPARFISESLRAEVTWLEEQRLISIVTYENVNPPSSALAQLEAELLNEINSRRAKLSREPLTPVEEMNYMARSLAAELSKGGGFTHTCPRFGDTVARAAARGLKINCEYLSLGLPDAAATVDAMLSAEQGGRLLADEARFLGLGLYKSTVDGNGDIYAVAEITEGEGFILGQRQRRLDTAELALNGYAVPGAQLTVYQLNEQGSYLARQTYALNVDSAGRFSFNLSLWQKGRFAVVLGGDRVVVTYE